MIRVHFYSEGEHHIVEVDQDLNEFLDMPDAFDAMKETIVETLGMPVDGAIMVEV